MKKLIKDFLVSKILVDLVNFFLKYLLRSKKILDSSYKKIGKFILVKDEDIFVTSYPKSGNTWVRLIIANILFKKNVSYNDLDDFLLEFYTSNESSFLNKKNRIFKTHDYFDHRFKKVIYIVRDPREVLVSSYYFQMKIGSINRNYSKRKFFKKFINGVYDSNFGSWDENVGSWHGAKNKNIIFIRYEDLIDNPQKEIRRLGKFLNKKITNRKLNEILKNTSFNSLKEKEKKISLNWIGLGKHRKDLHFFRSGKKNSWKKFLIPKENKLIKKIWSKNMRVFKYY